MNLKVMPFPIERVESLASEEWLVEIEVTAVIR
jgi:hypothetical protein